MVRTRIYILTRQHLKGYGRERRLDGEAHMSSRSPRFITGLLGAILVVSMLVTSVPMAAFGSAPPDGGGGTADGGGGGAAAGGGAGSGTAGEERGRWY